MLVPAIFAVAFLSAIAATVLAGFNTGLGVAFVVRCAGLLVLLTFISVTLLGTVPINQVALTWDPAAPPSNWRELVARWERLDTVRTWLALSAFALFLVAIAVQ